MRVSNYCKQAEKTPETISKHELATLKAADRATRVRETSRMAIAAGIIATAASPILGYNALTCVTITTAVAAVWLIAHCKAQSSETAAQEILTQARQPNHYKPNSPRVPK
jgi:hypothetical protein